MIIVGGFCPLFLTTDFFLLLLFSFRLFFLAFSLVWFFLLWRFLDQNHCRASSPWWWRLSFSLTLLLWQWLIWANWPELSSFSWFSPTSLPLLFVLLLPLALSLTFSLSLWPLPAWPTGAQPVVCFSTHSAWHVHVWWLARLLLASIYFPPSSLATTNNIKQNTSNPLPPLPPFPSVTLHPPCVCG